MHPNYQGRITSYYVYTGMINPMTLYLAFINLYAYVHTPYT